MLEYANHQAIRQRLWEELDRAQAEHLTASRQFDLVATDSGCALQDYIRALKRFTDFTLNGTVPEDLLPTAE
jgi:hypothetical protein